VRLTPPASAQVGVEPVAGTRLCLLAPPTRAGLERGLRILAKILESDEDVLV
jgi:hypothetical protein